MDSKNKHIKPVRHLKGATDYQSELKIEGEGLFIENGQVILIKLDVIHTIQTWLVKHNKLPVCKDGLYEFDNNIYTYHTVTNVIKYLFKNSKNVEFRNDLLRIMTSLFGFVKPQMKESDESVNELENLKQYLGKINLMQMNDLGIYLYNILNAPDAMSFVVNVSSFIIKLLNLKITMTDIVAAVNVDQIKSVFSKLYDGIAHYMGIIVETAASLFSEFKSMPNIIKEVETTVRVQSLKDIKSAKATQLFLRMVYAGVMIPFGYVFNWFPMDASFDKIMAIYQSKLSIPTSSWTIVESVSEFVSFMWERGYMFFKTRDFSYLSDINYEAIYIRKVMDILNKDGVNNPRASKDPVISTNYLKEIDELVDEGGKLVNSLRMKQVSTVGIMQQITVLERHRANYCFLLTSSTTRQTPVAFVLAGPSGIGKTVFQDDLAMQIMGWLGYPKLTQSNIYYRNPGDKYFSGYYPAKHPVIIMNELDVLNAQQKDTTHIMEMMSIIDNAQFNTNQAELEDKGKIMLDVALFLGSTNTPHLHAAHYMNCPSALYRRFGLIELSCKPEYCLPNSTQLDPNKIPANDMSMSHLHFVIKKYYANGVTGEWRTELDTGSYSVFLTVMKLMVLQHKENQDKVTRLNTSLFDLDTCSNCMSRGFACVCKNVQYSSPFVNDFYKELAKFSQKYLCTIDQSILDALHATNTLFEHNDYSFFENTLGIKFAIEKNKTWDELFKRDPSRCDMIRSRIDNMDRLTNEKLRSINANYQSTFLFPQMLNNQPNLGFNMTYVNDRGEYDPIQLMFHGCMFILYEMFTVINVFTLFMHVIILLHFPAIAFYWTLIFVVTQFLRLMNLGYRVYKYMMLFSNIKIKLNMAYCEMIERYVAWRYQLQVRGNSMYQQMNKVAIQLDAHKRNILIVLSTLLAGGIFIKTIANVYRTWCSRIQATPQGNVMTLLHPTIDKGETYIPPQSASTIPFPLNTAKSVNGTLVPVTLMDKLLRNTCTIQLENGNSVKGLFLTDECVIIPRHLFVGLKNKIRVRVIFDGLEQSSFNRDVIVWIDSPLMCHHVIDKDIILCQIHVPLRYDLVDCFCKTIPTNARATLFTKSETGHFEVARQDCVLSRNIFHNVLSKINVEGNGLRVSDIHTYAYVTGETHDGFCGSPILDEEVIYGIHHARKPQSLGNDIFYFVPLYQSVITQAVDEFYKKALCRRTSDVGFINFNMPASRRRDIKLGPLHPMSPFNHIKEAGSVGIIGSIATLGTSNPKTRHTFTPYFEDLPIEWKSEKQLPIMKPEIKERGDKLVYLDNMLVNVAYKNVDFIDPDLDALKRALDDINTIPSSIQVNWTRPLTTSEAINGIPGVRFLDKPMNMETSMGYPENTQKINCCIKTSLPGQRNVYEPPPYVIDQLDMYEEIYASGKRAHPITMGAMKDEPVSKKKNDNKEMRVFNVLPFSFNILCRKIKLPIMKLVMDNPLIFESALGMNVASRDWDFIYNRLKSVNYDFDQLSASDQEKFDIRTRTILTKLANLHEEFLAEHILKYDAHHMKLLRGINDDMCATIFVYNNDVVLIANGSPSGKVETADKNGKINRLAYRYCFYRGIHENQMISSPGDFHKYVALLVLGDDDISNVDKIIKFMTFSNKKRWMTEIGFSIKKSDKSDDQSDYDSLATATFLKRRFVVRDGLVWCPIEEESIQKTLSFQCKAKIPDKEVSAIHLSAACDNAFFYGRERHEELRTLCLNLAEKYALKPKIKTFDEIYQLYIDNKLGWDQAGFQY